MNRHIKQAEYVDVMIFAEGTYPYIHGGVSSWIHQLIRELPMFSFGICFIGSEKSDYGDMRYEFPENILHFEEHYMLNEFEDKETFHGKKSHVIDDIKQLHEWLRSPKGEFPKEFRSTSFYLNNATEDYFLHNKDVWDYISQAYSKNCPDIPFVDYFWTLRNMHKPIWLIASIADSLPKCGLFHSPSTGYAGFLAALSSYNNNAPLFISEHGIYTRERKIDLLNATWITYRKPILLKKSGEINYIKQMWINFFTKLGELTYHRSDMIFSLFPQAKLIQEGLGADPKKLEVIPNGVDVDGLGKTIENRSDQIPRVISLIGRVVTIKDIKTFIRSMRIVANSIPDVEGWIVGPVDEDKKYVEECKDMIASLGLNDHVKFLGFQNIYEILPKTGILTLTSISEGMPLTMLEGFAAGVPCVATDVGSCRNLIEGALDEDDIKIGHAGIVTGIANPAEIAKAYLCLFNDADLWRQMQSNGLERTNRYYRQEMFLSRYKFHYERVLADGRNRI